MPSVAISNGALACVDRGRGPVLLLVHGFPLDHSMWMGQIDELSQVCRVIAPDLRGFGGSAATAPPGEIVRMEQYADDLSDLLCGLGLAEPVTLCGLSMGGYIAWQFWRRHRPQLARLILCDTRAAPDSPAAAQGRRETAAQVLREGTAALAASMPDKLFAAETRERAPAVVAATQSVIAAASPQAVAAALWGMAERADARPWLGEIDVPTLLVCGAHDALTPLAEMRDVAVAIRGSQLAEIPAAGHMAPLEQPAAVNAALRGFLGL